MKVLGSTEWRAFSSGCREVVHLLVHTGWRMERFEQVARGVRLLSEATTAAAVRPPRADLLSLSALTILWASINVIFLSAFTCWTIFSNSHFGQFLLKAQ